MEEKEIVFKPPNNIEIEKNAYTYKGQLVNDFFSYRCKYRKNCQIIIK